MTKCAACVILVGLAEQRALIEEKPIAALLETVCSDLFPSSGQAPFRDLCDYLVDTYSAQIIERIEAKDTPDEVCAYLSLCTGQCTLFPPPTAASWASRPPKSTRPFAGRTRGSSPAEAAAAFARFQQRLESRKPTGWGGGESPWDWFQALIDRFAQDHGPIEDVDGDGFSELLHEFRGRDWNGRDCDGINENVYPGRRADDGSSWATDRDCNGIPDADEPTYCSPRHRRGVLAVGDSASAHFHIPAEWLTAATFNATSFRDVVYIAENELDWPHMARDTGHYPNGTTLYTPQPAGWVRSSYQRILERDLCNHRDYQTVSWNGARVGAVGSVLNTTLRRNASTDYSALVFYALVGNDVCNGHADTVAHMTKPAEFAASVWQDFQELDAKLPAGSTVIVTGLVDGRVLFDVMGSLIHPIGRTRGDVKYSAVYDFLGCLGISPCLGWLNTNATLRNLTSERAALLNAQYPVVIANSTFRHIKVAYMGPWDVMRAVSWLKSMGLQPEDTIEPVDGFHPSTWGNFALNTFLWDDLAARPDYEQIMGVVNPNNAAIKAKYGDQGGY